MGRVVAVRDVRAGFALSEARQAGPGSRSVLLRLSELMFVEVVRCCVTEQHAARTGWLAGLSDPLVGRALIALHHEPARSWTLEALARDIGSSRTQLAESFARIVRVPPMQYLTQWRMQLAAKLLSGAPTKVAGVARQVGYASEAAFSRAFKRFAGVSPARWRRPPAAARD